MFKNYIPKRRLELGLYQTKLACLIGLATSNLSNVETVQWKPWPRIKRDLARVLGRSIQELFREV